MTDKTETTSAFVNVGDKVDFTLPENETIGGKSTFEATVTRVYDDGETVDLEFLPPDAESEKVLRTSVPYGPMTGAWFHVGDTAEDGTEAELPNISTDNTDAGTGIGGEGTDTSGSGADGSGGGI